MNKTGLVLLGYLLPLLSPFKVVLALGLLPPKEFWSEDPPEYGEKPSKGEPSSSSGSQPVGLDSGPPKKLSRI